jgi:predicted RNase H-like HicB family nuclease/uncharacterized damage-inducible protein DinB
MQTYKLYLESGPRKKKTMAHALDLLGCIARGSTTDEALDRTPEAIRAYLRFLKRHDQAVDPNGEFATIVAEHVTDGEWLGNGDPALVFQPDLEPLSLEDEEKYIQRLQWTRAEVVALVGALTGEQVDAEQHTKDRSIRAMLEHMLDSEYFYVSTLGKIHGLPGIGTIVKKQQGDLLDWMSHVRTLEVERIRSLTADERSQPVVHWKRTWTARKVLRRMLEHEWEHLVELSERLEKPL